MICKIVLVFALVAILQATASFNLNKKAFDASKECAKELNIKDIKKAYKPDNKDPNAKCFKHCVGLKLNYIQVSGEPIIENIPKMVNFTAYVKNCSKSHSETDKCERVNNISKCVRKMSEANVQRISDVCAKENNVVVGDIKKLKENALANVMNTTLHCYFRCVAMKTTLMDAEGNLKIEEFKSVIDAPKYEKISKAIEQCNTDNNQSDVCTKSVKRVVCMGQKALKHKMQNLED